MKWFRVWHGSATDPKWRTVARRSGQPVAIVYAVWTLMLETASGAAERGVLEGWNDEVAADALDLEPSAVAAIREAMSGLTLDGQTVINWQKFQPKREDCSLERVQRHRNAVKRTVTQSNAPERDTDRDTESEKKVEAPQAAHTTRGTRFPYENQPEPWKAFCLEKRPELDPSATFDRCRDYWIAQPGQRGVKRDWDATWRNWVRNERSAPKSIYEKPVPTLEEVSKWGRT